MSTSREERTLQSFEDVKLKEPIVHKVLEKPVLQEIQEVKNVSVVHKDVVTEIHEQPIIEIARKPEVVHIEEQPFVQKIKAPTKFEDIQNGFGTPELNLKQGEVHNIEEIGDVKHINLGEDVRQVTKQELIERHIVPTVTEIHEQKVINVIEQPIVRKIIEQPIVREVTLESTTLPTQEWKSSQSIKQEWRADVPQKLDSLQQNVEMRDSSIERERQLPTVQESTHVLVGQGVVGHEGGVLGTAEFADELSRGKTLLHTARPFASESFQEEIKYGQEVLHTARPFAATTFAGELWAQKKMLKKSRYFSKIEFVPAFMAQKKLLKPVEGNLYSEELSKLGNWKSDYFGKELVQSATNVLWNAYEKVSHSVVDTYENVKEKIVGH